MTQKKYLEPGIYRHYKGQEYDVIEVARHSETEEWVVVYRQCYGDKSLWVRPYEMFTEKVVLADGSQADRFAKVAQ